jgi:hypothetical protein
MIGAPRALVEGVPGRGSLIPPIEIELVHLCCTAISRELVASVAYESPAMLFLQVHNRDPARYRAFPRRLRRLWGLKKLLG